MADRSKSKNNVLGERIKLLRLDWGFTQKELAAHVNKSESAVRMWELGKSEPDIETIKLLAQIFDVSTDQIITDTPELLYALRPASATKLRGTRIPVYGSVAAGIPIEAITDIEDYEEIPEDLSRTGQFAALKIKGDSMEPRFTEGDVVIVKLQDTVENGDIAVVLVNGDEATCKKIKKTPEGVMLISTNPAYEPMFYSNKEINEKPVRIWGRVIELRAKF